MAKQMMDIALQNNKSLIINDGDFQIIESTNEHQVQLLLNNKGDFKQSPTVCVGAVKYVDDEGPGNLINAISTEFQRDGMDVQQVALNAAGVIQASAYYI